MNIVLIEKFISCLAPASAKKAINSMFVGMKEDPSGLIMQGFQHLSDTIRDEGSTESAAAVNGILLGIALVYTTHQNKDMEKILKGYLDCASRMKGENVINFWEAKAGKLQ